MGFNWNEMWAHMGWPAICVALVLMVMGLASLTVFMERLFTLRRSSRQSRRFAGQAGNQLRREAIESVIAIAKKHPAGHLPRLVQAALSHYRHATETADISSLGAAERTRRYIERYLEDMGADLRRGLPVLASVGSVAPFVGLLGTVLGIISAFQGIAQSGSGGLSSVSAGISEALIETALGLAVAIPAVLAYNYLATRIARHEAALTAAAGELVDSLEGWEEEQVREHEQPPVKQRQGAQLGRA